MRLFFDHAGPMLSYEDGFLHVADLNPELRTKWSMARWEMFKLGLRCLLASLVR
ncbi:hypothetical protein [Bradyrhizobium japonicum]|uniref:hypothetical protein n=1 Tax=Bradyrhizobium japonicum TaxID=375 RepID=UPI001E2C8EB0|nr:hypothetical protein [Bradyrhizobium japonicum]MCD9821165.1 hypothetical protein [Bradyrhizobium japonicum]MEB2674138.1 hypothetical protein [Bradyrhizobium japonicum]WRI93325.1 hypothetical protein R3F75_21270 [Bradyrhizobium japonicum]